MYIPFWHKQIFDSDPIKATLFIANNIDPKNLLNDKYNNFSLAQICVTSNNNKGYYPELISDLQWNNFKEIKESNIFSSSRWVNDSYTRNIALNGHVNIGEITLKGKTPSDAIKKLSSYLIKEHTPAMTINNERCFAVFSPLKLFGKEIGRYKVRKANNKDINSLIKLLSGLTTNVTKNTNISFIPDGLETFVVEDKFLNKIVATVSIHSWNRFRGKNEQKTCYIHELVHQDYRNIGLGTLLLQRVLDMNKNVKKLELACSSDLEKYYEIFGFKRVGSCMVMYNK